MTHIHSGRIGRAIRVGVSARWVRRVSGAAAVVGALIIPVDREAPLRAAATPNVVAHWNRIAEDAVIRSRAFQNEGLIYMAYVSAAVYDAVVAIDGGYAPYGGGVRAFAPASAEAAVVEAAYRTLINYFPTQASTLDPLYADALAAIPAGTAKANGQAVGQAAAQFVIDKRVDDGRKTPVGVSSDVNKKRPGPGVWRLTPPAFLAPQTPWVGDVDPFLLDSVDRFMPDGPPSLASSDWAEAFSEIARVGSAASTERTPEQTSIALFWTANVIRQYNQLLRDVIDSRALNLRDSARLQAMVNIVGADAQIAVMHAKYRFLFWRPVTAIDRTSVTAADGFGPAQGFTDGNMATTEQTGWRPLIVTPNHPEYPAAHGSITSAMAEVFSEAIGTPQFMLTIHGFDPAGPVGNLNATRTFTSASQLRREIVDARVFAGVHYRFSGVAGVALGRSVAKYDLRHAFQRVSDDDGDR